MKVELGTRFTITVAVTYSFTTSTYIEVDIYDYGAEEYLEDIQSADRVQGQGQKPYQITLEAPSRNGFGAGLSSLLWVSKQPAP